MKELLSMLWSIYPLSEPLVNYLRSVLMAIELRKKDFLLKKGQISNHIYFIQKGILRCYLDGEDGKETTKWFMDEGNVIVSVDSFFSRTPSVEAIHALEDCLLYGISYDELEYAYRNFMEFNFHGRQLTTNYYVLSDRRVTMLQRLRAPERYLYTKETQPKIVERVAGKYLATYLGIEEETLSRIRKKYD